MWRATEKQKWGTAFKAKPKALPHFKVDPVIKIDDTFYKQSDSMLLHLCEYYLETIYEFQFCLKLWMKM